MGTHRTTFDQISVHPMTQASSHIKVSVTTTYWTGQKQYDLSALEEERGFSLQTEEAQEVEIPAMERD